MVSSLGQDIEARPSEIYVTTADGSNPVNLTNNPATDAWPSWLPVQ